MCQHWTQKRECNGIFCTVCSCFVAHSCVKSAVPEHENTYEHTMCSLNPEVKQTEKREKEKKKKTGFSYKPGCVLHLPTEKQLNREDQFKPVWTQKGRTYMVFAFNTTVNMTFSFFSSLSHQSFSCMSTIKIKLLLNVIVILRQLC